MIWKDVHTNSQISNTKYIFHKIKLICLKLNMQVRYFSTLTYYLSQNYVLTTVYLSWSSKIDVNIKSVQNYSASFNDDMNDWEEQIRSNYESENTKIAPLPRVFIRKFNAVELSLCPNELFSILNN